LLRPEEPCELQRPIHLVGQRCPFGVSAPFVCSCILSFGRRSLFDFPWFLVQRLWSDVSSVRPRYRPAVKEEPPEVRWALEGLEDRAPEPSLEVDNLDQAVIEGQPDPVVPDVFSRDYIRSIVSPAFMRSQLAWSSF